MLSSTIIPLPASDKDFEEKCVVLFAGLLNDPNVKTVGTKGQGQQGLDLLGARDRDPDQPVGVQCIGRRAHVSPRQRSAKKLP
jgi:hypothetical protein